MNFSFKTLQDLERRVRMPDDFDAKTRLDYYKILKFEIEAEILN